MTLWLEAAVTFFVTTFLLTLLSGSGSFSLSMSTSIAFERARWLLRGRDGPAETLGAYGCDMTVLSTLSSSRKKSGLSMKSSPSKLYSVSVRGILMSCAFARVGAAAEDCFLSSSDSISIIVVVRVSGEKIPFFTSCDAVISGLGFLKNRDFSTAVPPEGGFLAGMVFVGAFRFRVALLSLAGFVDPGWGPP